MKPTSCLKLLGVGAIALVAIVALSQPSYAKKKPKVTVTKDTPSTSSNTGTTVVPVVPSAPAAPGPIAPGPVGAGPGGVPGMICVPGGPAPCATPPVAKPIAKDYFFCGQSSHGTPTTYVNTPTGNIPLVRWVSHYFAHSGYSPEVRCQDVSQRFNNYYNQGVLNYVTTGIVNGLPVICVASEIGGPCTGVLFTLKPNEDATRVVQQLFDVRAGASGPLHESGSRVYIDISKYVKASR